MDGERPGSGFSHASERYQLIQQIGSGSYGATVWYALDTASGKEVAVKEIDLDDMYVYIRTQLIELGSLTALKMR